MTPPDANLRKQKARHWPVILGISVATALAVVAGLAVGALEEDASNVDAAAEPVASQADGTGGASAD